MLKYFLAGVRNSCPPRGGDGSRFWQIFDRGVLGHKQVPKSQISLPHGLSIYTRALCTLSALFPWLKVLRWHQTVDFSISWRHARTPSINQSIKKFKWREEVGRPEWEPPRNGTFHSFLCGFVLFVQRDNKLWSGGIIQFILVADLIFTF